MRHGWTAITFLSLFVMPVSILRAEAVDPSDATLYGVDFIDAQEGWAVGEQGTVWHTIDGGKTWDRQNISTTATLTTVRMDAPWSGMIGARESLPFAPGSTGQVYRTRNGGVAWTPTVEKPPFGGVRHLWVGEQGKGLAVGESSDVHPSGITVTSDGGATWIPLRGPIDLGWTASLALDEDHLLCASPNGHVMLFHDLELSRDLDLQMPEGCAVRSFVRGGGRIWAVGDRCQVFSSGDSGMSWHRVELPIPKEVGEVLDLSSIAAQGTHVWMAGRPGSVVIHSGNSGQTWEVQKTGTPMPLFGMEFINESCGWGVGAMGTIIATKDGGQTWTTQRQGDHVASVLWITAHPENAPLDGVARLGGKEGYRNVVLALCPPSADLLHPGSSCVDARFSEAIRSAGGTHAETSRSFTRPRPVMKPWLAKKVGTPTTSDARSTDQVERDLVLALRLWQPTVVILDPAAPNENEWNPGTLLVEIMESAFDKAADPNVYSEQLSVLGLGASSAQKLFAVQAEEKNADTLFAVAKRGQKEDIGTLALAALAQARLHVAPRSVRETIPLQTLRSKSKDHSSIFAGIDFIAPDSSGRRAATLVPPDAPDREELLLTVDVSEFPSSPQEQRKILDDLLQKGGDPLPAGWALYELSQQLVAGNRPADAKRMLDYLIIRFPNHPYATPAYRRLITQQASDEVHCVDGKAVPRDAESRQRELRLALAYGRKLQEDRHILARDPGMSILLASAARRLGQDDLARNFLSFAEESSLRWNPIALLESERLGNTPHSASHSRICEAVSTPLTINGQMNDACWDGKNCLTLSSGDNVVDPSFKTEVKLRYDDNYLYIGADCQALAPVPGDRLVVSLDIDRDYTTFVEYSGDRVQCITPAGTREMKAEGVVVQRQQSDKGWCMEMAIPLSSLVASRELLKKDAWGIDVRRYIPGIGMMTATHDRNAAVAKGEPCPLIEFNDDADSQPAPLRAN